MDEVQKGQATVLRESATLRVVSKSLKLSVQQHGREISPATSTRPERRIRADAKQHQKGEKSNHETMVETSCKVQDSSKAALATCYK